MKQQLRQEHRFPAHMQSQSSQRPAGEVSRINQLISPGHLPNNLTVEKIRNPILVSYVAKGLLPYHGLGSGIQRAREQWPLIEFVDDPDGCTFTVTVTRKTIETLQLANEAKPEKDHLKDLSGQYDPINDLLNAIRGAPSCRLCDFGTKAWHQRIYGETQDPEIQAAELHPQAGLQENRTLGNHRMILHYHPHPNHQALPREHVMISRFLFHNLLFSLPTEEKLAAELKREVLAIQEGRMG